MKKVKKLLKEMDKGQSAQFSYLSRIENKVDEINDNVNLPYRRRVNWNNIVLRASAIAVAASCVYWAFFKF